jgi:hypothetical protein
MPHFVPWAAVLAAAAGLVAVIVAAVMDRLRK